MTIYSADPTAKYVSIFCEGTEANPHSIWRIGTYRPERDIDAPAGAPAYWSESKTGYQSPESDTLIPINGKSIARLAGDKHVSREESRRNPDALNQGDSRTRFRFECGVCKKLVARRAEAVFPLFDKLSSVGVSVLSLNALAARL